ncbi:MAG TPA: MBL fold metallo-hydrolase, partial [Thermoleophilaceae bacterium]|nr:MBL fold metallo-hydrolase [Thermoleophilaceae bacterium]
MKLTVVGCSPAWPNPGGAQSGYLLEGPGRLLLDCGPGVLARLRESHSSNGWPEVDAIAITHFHLDHWGDLVPWVWGTMWGLGQGTNRPQLWLPPGGREELAAFGTRFGTPDMFVRVFEPMEYAEGEPFMAAGLEVTAVRLPHYTVQTYGFRVSNT